MKKIIINIAIISIFFTPIIGLQAADQSGSVAPGVTQQPGRLMPSPNGSGVKESVTLQNPFAFKTVGQLMDKLLDIIIKVGSVIALFFIIYSGFLFVTAAGSEDKVASAKATFLWTIIGVAIVLGAKALSVLIQGTVNNITGQ
jgi:hypothetical protein